MDRDEKKKRQDAYKNRTVIGGVYAIVNTDSGKRMLCYTTDMQGSRNRFEFSQKMNTCVHPRLKDDWKKLGGSAFRFDELETLKKGKEQADSDFLSDIKELFDITAKGAKPDSYA